MQGIAAPASEHAAPEVHNPRGNAARVVILAFVRNECPTWAEWLGHHRAQGVAHFYAIDHNSTDAGHRLRGSRRGGGAKTNATSTPAKKSKHTICVFDWRLARRFSTGAMIPDPLSEIQPDHNLVAKLGAVDPGRWE